MTGRKSKYYSHVEPNFEVIKGLLRSGHTEKSIAESLGVGASTWKKYKSMFRDFQDLIKKSVLDSTAPVVNSLYKRANGYEYEETHVIFNAPQKDKSGKVSNQIREIKKITKFMPPDVAAGIFIVTNRDPEHWKNTQNIKLSGEVKNTGVLLTAPPMSKEEWLKQHQKQNEKTTELGENEQKKVK